MKQFLKNTIALTVILSMLTLGINMLLPTNVSAFTNSFSATEEVINDWESGVDLAFTVTNIGYVDIVEFAIGNPDASGAWTENDFNGVIAYKNEVGHWTAGGDDRDLFWLDTLESFNEYNKAFLFTSWDEDSETFTKYLENGTTYNYFGTTGAFFSPVGAYTELGEIIDGGEAQVVPIQGAFWLLGSGLIGLFGFRRRK
jgi:hypothetical protein